MYSEPHSSSVHACCTPYCLHVLVMPEYTELLCPLTDYTILYYVSSTQGVLLIKILNFNILSTHCRLVLSVLLKHGCQILFPIMKSSLIIIILYVDRNSHGSGV